MKRKFIEFEDEHYSGEAVDKLNEEIKKSHYELVNTQYQVVRYEHQNKERTYILSEWILEEKQ